MIRLRETLLPASLFLAGMAMPTVGEPLPGVSTDHQIVKPMPDQAEQPPSGEKEPIRVGDWDVRVSGSITVDIGVGKTKLPRH